MSQLSYKTLFIILLFLLIPVVFLLRINQKPTNTLAAWWNDSWTYRQSINISSHSSAESNVYLTTTINIGTTNKSQIDNGDFRFLNQSGQLLDYYISSGAGTTAPVFHIQIPSFPGGAQTIYAYYGNPSISNGFSVSDFSTAASNYTIGSLGSEEIGGGPIAHWKFDEGIGTTAYDSSGHQYNGIFGPGSSAPTWTDASQCISGKCLFFDGTNDQVIIPSLSKINTPYTVSFWVKPKKSNTEQTILSLRGSNSYPKFQIQPNNKFLSYAGTEKYRYSSITSNINNWQLVTYVVTDGTNLSNWKIYINDQEKTGTSGGNTGTYFEPGQPAYIGNAGGSQFYQGFIDDIKIYPYARSTTQILQEYNTSKSGQSSSDSTNTSFGSSSQKSLSDGLVGYWKFDEGTATTVVDYSGYNQNLGITWKSAINPSPWAPGKWGSSFQDAGYEYSNDEKAGTTWKAPTQTDFSLSLWFNPSTTAPLTNSNGYIVSRWWGDCSDSYTPGWAINYSFSTKKLNFRIAADNCGPDGNLSTGTSFSPNTWHHLVAVHKSGESIKMYINGVLDSQMSYTLGLNSSAPNLSFGCGANNNNCGYPGLTDETRIYNRALSADEVKQLYNYDPNPPSHTPIVWYKLDNSVGNTIPNSGSLGNQANGISTTATLQFLDGKINKSLRFTGSNYVNVGISIPTQAYTKSLWVKYASGGTNYNILSGSSGNVLYAANGNGNKLASGHNGSWTTVQDSVALDTNWHHVAVTYDYQNNGSLKLYKDARLVSSAVGISPPSGDTGFYLGAWSGGNTWVGQIDEAKIYDYALSADEIKNDYNQSSSVVFGVTNLTVGNTSTLANYCVPGSTDPCAPPVGEWKFEEGTGTTAFDTSGNGKNGIFGAGSSAPTWTTGKIGKALSFDSNDLINVTDNDSLTSTNMTFSAWIKLPSIPATRKSIISKYYEHSAPNSEYNLWITSTGKIQLTGNGTNSLTSNSTLPINSWQHITGIINGSSSAIYINGIGDTFGNITAGSNTTTSFMIGGVNNPDVGELFSGSLDQVRIFNYARTPAQIALDYNQGAPIAHFKFDECQGNISHSSTGIGLTGTISIGSGGSQSSLGTCTVGTSAAWTNGATGKFNSSLNFDGTDDKVITTNTASLQLTTGTISTWIKTANAGPGYRGVVAKQNAYGIFLNNNVLGMYDWGAAAWRSSGYSPNDGNWHHLLCSFQSGVTNGTMCYVDAQLKLTTTITVLNQNVNLQIGEANASQYFNGLIDDVQIYNYALTPEQIKQLYNGGAINFN